MGIDIIKILNSIKKRPHVFLEKIFSKNFVAPKYFQLFFSLLTIFLYSVAVTFAAYPTTPFSSSDQMLDPPCIPGGTNCYVSSGGGFTGTEGSIPFADSAGSLTEDNTNLFWDDTNNRLGILDATPSSALTIGSGDLFQVNSSGDIVKINNVTYSWPASQGASSTYFQNDGSGNLSWVTPGGSSLQLYSENPSSPTSNTVTGANAFGIGSGITSSGIGSVALGISNTASGDYATAFGNTNVASGAYSTALGIGNTAPSYGETVIGTYASTYTPVSATSFDSSDRLFTIGRGTSSGVRANALTILKSGYTNIGTDTTPDNLFTVGSSSQFQVDSSGNLVKINNVTYSWPGSQGASSTYLKNDGSGILTWEAISAPSAAGLSGELQYNNSGSFGGTTGLIYSGGNIGIGDSSPASLLTIGDGDLFQVDSSGNLVKINNVTYSWPSTQGGATTYLKNNGSGTLAWTSLETAAGSDGQIQYNNNGVLGASTYLSWSGTILTVGNNSTFIGSGAGTSASFTANLYNVSVGPLSGASLDGTANYNTFVGYSAGQSAVGSLSNTLLGYSAGNDITSGDENTFIGSYVGESITTGSNNVLMGDNIYGSTALSYSVVIGSGAGGASLTPLTGNGNVIIGYNAGNTVEAGTDNVILGSEADAPGSNRSVVIGYNSSAAGYDDVVIIGQGITATADRQVIIAFDDPDVDEAGYEMPVIFGKTNMVTSDYALPILQSATPYAGTNLTGIDFSLSGGKATGNAAGGSLKFYTSDAGASGTTMQSITEKMRIEADGGIFMYNLATSTGGAGYDAICLNASTEELTINTNGDDCVVSSARFKTEIKNLNLGLDFVNQLIPRTFTYKNDGSKRIGFIAEEIAPLDTRLVFYETDGTTVRGVNYQDMTAVLAKAIQELDVRVEGLTILLQKNTSDSLFSSFKNAFISWLSETLNGIKDLVADNLWAKNEICIDDICITKEKLKIIFENNGLSQNQENNNESTNQSGNQTNEEPVVSEDESDGGNLEEPIVSEKETDVLEETVSEESLSDNQPSEIIEDVSIENQSNETVTEEVPEEVIVDLPEENTSS